MRVSAPKQTTAPYAMPFSWFENRIDMDDEGESIPFEMTLSSDMLPPQQTPNVSETFSNDIWVNILPGLERVCIVLRSQEYSHAEIAWMIGMKTDEVSRILYKVKNRLMKLGVAAEPTVPDRR